METIEHFAGDIRRWSAQWRRLVAENSLLRAENSRMKQEQARLVDDLTASMNVLSACLQDAESAAAKLRLEVKDDAPDPARADVPAPTKVDAAVETDEAEVVTCDVCLMPFDDGRRAIMAMPCGHVICRDCTNHLLTRACHTCRRPIDGAFLRIYMT